MGKLKVDLVNRAYDWLRISGRTSNPLPEEVAIALDIQENMMYEFQSRNICSSWVFEECPDPNTDSRLEPEYNEAVSTSLALRLAALFGKSAPQELVRMATQSLSNWSARSGKVNQIAPPRRQPKGSGNTFRFINWDRYYRAGESAPISCDTFQLKVGEINVFNGVGSSLDFTDYLNDLEAIVSFETKVTDGLDLITISEVDGLFTIEVQGLGCGYNTILLTVTTSDGRVNPRQINFNVTE